MCGGMGTVEGGKGGNSDRWMMGRVGTVYGGGGE